MNILNIKIQPNVILNRDLTEDYITFYEIIYKENKEKKIFTMQTYNEEITPFTKEKLIKYFKTKIEKL
jgi:hypothetical protein